MTKYSKKIRYTAFGIFAFLILLALLLVLEVVFRFNPEYGRAGFAFDTQLVWRLNKGLVATKAYAMGQAGKEPFVLKFNNKGFRGEKFRKKKPANAKRILVIGDSYTAGLDYPDNEVFTGQLESALNESADTRYEVLNASCPAWGTDQQYAYWETEGHEYQPDYVLVMVAPNDIREMYNKKLVSIDEQGNITRKKATLPKKERLGWWLATRSSFYQFLQKKVFHTNYGDFLKVFHYYPVNYGIKDSADWDLPIFLKDPFPEVQASYQMCEKLLKTIDKDCKAMGAKLMLGIIPTKAEFDGTYEKLEECQPGTVAVFLDSITRENQIPFLNLYNINAAEEDPLRIFMSWEYHFNKAGHDFTAKHLVPFVKSNF
ncbi:MAG: hypothetical protein DHS20C18_18830 [Saprospiraceae bacterium]|nr:MAG: hypothetical protein DHS20C18_18830 [Saprospiraceae bacterium]